MKKLCLSIVASIFGVFSSFAGLSWISKGIVAVVNEEPITQQQLEEEIQEQIAQLRNSESFNGLSDERFEEIKAKCLDNLIEQRLLTQYFSEKNGKVLQNELDNHLKEIEQRNFHGNRELFTKYLISKGKTFAGFKKEIERSLIIGAMMSQKSVKPMSISFDKIENYYNANISDFTEPATVKLHQIIFLKTAYLPDSEQLKVDFAKKSLEQGMAFDELAKALDEFNTAPNWYLLDELHKDILPQIQNAKVGDITGVSEIGDHCFISKILEKKEERKKPLNEVQHEIEKKCIEQENIEAYNIWLKELKSKSYIKTR